MGPLVNPYAKPRQAVPVVAHNAANMGRQSQHHVANQHKRKFKLCDNSNKKRRKGDQLTLQGNVAFNPEVDCKVCKAKHIHKFILPGYPIPKRAHHSLCSLNTKTRGLGELSEQALNSITDNKCWKHSWCS